MLSGAGGESPSCDEARSHIAEGTCTGSGSRLLKPGLTQSDPQMTAAVVPAQDLTSPSSSTLPGNWAEAFSLSWWWVGF